MLYPIDDAKWAQRGVRLNVTSLVHRVVYAPARMLITRFNCLFFDYNTISWHILLIPTRTGAYPNGSASAPNPKGYWSAYTPLRKVMGQDTHRRVKLWVEIRKDA